MTLFLTIVSILAFAANSLLARQALGNSWIDPISFTTLRLVSGALVLIPVSRMLAGRPQPAALKKSWKAGLSLFFYAAAFSVGYVSITASMGTLIMVGSVQVTMIGYAILTGERLSLQRWLGSLVSVGGLVCLVFPGISAPNPVGALLMLISGAAWGIYSICGRGASAPITMTAMNFRWAAPIAVLISLLFYPIVHAELRGVLLALCSGSLTSALGYIVWYRTLRNLSTSAAAIVQLLIPVITAFGGITFLAEELSIRLLLASALILGGVALSLARKQSI